MKFYRWAFIGLAFLTLVLPARSQDSIWALEAVDATGEGTHAKVGAPAIEANKVTIQGIALNRSDAYLNPNQMWQIYIQAEAPDQGGIAAWAGIFYNSNWPRYPETIEPGDRVEITGYVSNVNGKVNINERHSAAPELQFQVTLLQEDVGMPAPVVIPNIAACNFFDETRATGGEKYQAQWAQMNDIEIVSGTWGAGQTLIVGDISGATMALLLSARGDFDSFIEPSGEFDPVGIFDQEDAALPYHENYRLWVKDYADLGVPASVQDWKAY